MKILLIVLVAFGGASTLPFDESFHLEWNNFKTMFEKKYHSAGEENFRKGVFEKNRKKIEEINLKYKAGQILYQSGINQFSDMLPEEIDALYSCANKPNRMRAGADEEAYWPDLQGELFIPKNLEAPDYVNWVENGAVTKVKNQLACGSCYAFASLAALEGRNFIKTKKLTSLSVQNVVDCSWGKGNEGCNGGLSVFVYDYIKENGGVNSEESYPYEARDGSCRFDSDEVAATIKGYYRLKKKDEEELKLAVASGPVTVSIDASQMSFKMYKSGIYKDSGCSSTKMNHAVVVVGYGTDEETGQDYWLIKNSWDTTWGENGYVKLARNANNTCGIVNRPIFPKL